MDPTQIIITRLLKEVQPGQTIALGRGIPQLIKPHLETSIKILDLTPTTESQPVQLAVVEAEEVSQMGDFSLTSGQEVPSLEADLWVVTAPHSRADGTPRIVQTYPAPHFAWGRDRHHHHHRPGRHPDPGDGTCPDRGCAGYRGG